MNLETVEAPFSAQSNQFGSHKECLGMDYKFYSTFLNTQTLWNRLTNLCLHVCGAKEKSARVMHANWVKWSGEEHVIEKCVAIV